MAEAGMMPPEALGEMLFLVVASSSRSSAALVRGLGAARAAVARAMTDEYEPLSEDLARLLDTLPDLEAWEPDPGQVVRLWSWNLAYLDGFVLVQRVTEWPRDLVRQDPGKDERWTPTTSPA